MRRSGDSIPVSFPNAHYGESRIVGPGTFPGFQTWVAVGTCKKTEANRIFSLSGVANRNCAASQRLRRPFDGRPDPSTAAKSRLLRFKVPPANFPTEGPPTPRSRRPVFAFDLGAGFSRIIPFSLASRRRLSSFCVAFDLIPLRIEEGILCWL